MVRIRPGTLTDTASIASWTTDTFDWGDYVPRRFETWIADPDSEVLVCVDENDSPIALANVATLSATEAWIEAARVHPDHRRQGLGSALNQAGVEWARQRGSRVMRLTTMEDNVPAASQVEGLGYRSVSRWFHAEIEVGASFRCDAQFRLRPSIGPDAEAAWMSWSTSELAREGREMIPLGWRWRRARPEDVIDPEEPGSLFQSAAGWASVIHHDDQAIEARWLATSSTDLLALLDGLVDLTASRGLPELKLKMPDVGWTREAARRHGAEVSPLIIWSKQI